MEMADPAWVTHETTGAQFPDKRLTKRLETVVTQLSRDPPNTIPACSTDWRELIGCYRFFHNRRVTTEQILSGHKGATLARIERQRMVLAVQDSTELCFECSVAVVDKGTARGVTRQRVFCHLSAVFDEARTNLGVIGVDFWQRPAGGKRLRPKGSRVGSLPLEAKESYRWVRHYEKACEVQARCPATTVLSVADREIEWMLLTSLPVETLAHAHALLGCYRNRWEIELFFRVLKRQCRVEELKLESFARLQKAVAVYMMVGWRIHNITMMSRRYPDAKADVLYTANEWQTVYRLTEQRQPPRRAPPLRAITGMIARLGGFIGRKGDGEPGVLNLCRGHMRLLHGIWIAETLEATH